MTVRTAQCDDCGFHAVFDTWPGQDGDEALEQSFLEEDWTYQGDRELCPDCSGGEE